MLSHDPAPNAAVDDLTDQERRIVELLVEGCSQQQTASRLFISVSTLRVALHKLRRRLGVQSNEQLVAVLFRKGWLR